MYGIALGCPCLAWLVAYGSQRCRAAVARSSACNTRGNKYREWVYNGYVGYPLYLLPPGNTADPIAAAYVTRQVNTLMAGRARLAALQSVDYQYDVVRLADLVRT